MSDPYLLYLANKNMFKLKHKIIYNLLFFNYIFLYIQYNDLVFSDFRWFHQNNSHEKFRVRVKVWRLTPLSAIFECLAYKNIKK